MSKTLDFLRKSGVFYVATSEGNQPRVRPFGAACVYKGKLYICTNNQKNVFRQIQESPKLEICAMTPDGKWIRIEAQGKSDADIEAKKVMLAENPSLAGMYSLEDGIFEVIRLDNMIAKVYSFTEPTKSLDD